jgi:hypothetical protein
MNKDSTRFQLPPFDATTATLEEKFHFEMLRLYVAARDQTGYSARRFPTAVRKKGALAHAKDAIRRPFEGQTGLQRLQDEGLLHMSMESVMLSEEFKELFSPRELEAARSRLAKVKAA